MFNNHALLVPIGVQALVVNQTDKHSTIWSLGHKQYTGIDKFEPLEPPPFIRGNDWPRAGITLRWALPDALTRGRQTDSGLVFPIIPNRWLIVRTIVSPAINNAPGERLKAWVVESDYLGPDGSNLYPDPRDRGQSVTKIGRSWELEPWINKADHTPVPPHLTAIGPGDTTFTAYLANIDNVLSFYDELQGLLDLEKAASLSYMVLGWHAQPKDAKDPDPLAEDEPWKALLKRYGWSLGDDLGLRHAIDDAWGEQPADPTENFPSRTVYHGQVNGVKWSGMYGPAQTGPLTRQNQDDNRGARKQNPQAKPERTQIPTVAFGNSSIDALASLMEYFLEMENNPVDISTLIQALEYGMVRTYDSPGGQDLLDQRIHAEWFAGLPGGTYWELAVAAKQTAPDSDDLSQNGASRPTTLNEIKTNLTTRLNAALASEEAAAEQISDLRSALEVLTDLKQSLSILNQKQTTWDRDQRKLRSKQEALYALWWKSKRLPQLRDQPLGVSETKLKEGLAKAPEEFSDLSNQLKADEDQTSAREKTLRDEISKTDSDTYQILYKVGVQLQLRRASAPRFYQPSDPVALIYGMRRGAEHGEDGRFTDDGTLFVRFSRAKKEAPGQTIRSFGSLFAADLITFFKKNALQTVSALEAGIKHEWIPPEALDLLVETTLLDVTQTETLSDLMNENAENIRRRQKMIWQDYRQIGLSTAYLTQAAGLVGVRPSPLAVEIWSPPWSPLFLCWRVTFFPSDTDLAKAMDDWRFNGLDYDWNAREPIQYKKSFTLQGRTLLIRTSTDALAQHLEGLFKQLHGEALPAAVADTLERVKKKLRSADLLSHPLTGFNDQLIMQDPQQYYNPDDKQIWGLIGNIRRAAPMPYGNGSSDSHFYPIRAGHFRLQRIWVVDAFGQVFDPIYEQGVTAASFTPIRGSGFAPPGLKQRTDTQMLQLPPRIIQPSRLLLRFVPAADHGVGAFVNGRPVILPEATIVELASTIPPQDDNPICGWLLPNHFDKSLAMYDSNGRALGTLLLSGSAGESRLTWQSAVKMTPSMDTPLNLGNVHLQGFVKGLMEHLESGKVFTGLMATIDSTLWTTDPLGQRQDNLSTLIGRPLALVRARLELELAQDPLSDQSWEKTLVPDSKGYEQVRFPVELGHLNLREDGTLGYFMEAENKNPRSIDYSRFYALHETRGVVESDYFADQRLPPPLTVQASTPSDPRDRHVTLIMDPRGSVHARCGILPTKAIQLPTHSIESALANMDVTFRVGPIVNAPHGMRMPLPAEIRGGWSWIARTGVNLWLEEEVAPADQHASLSGSPLALREGWLKLSDVLGEQHTQEE